MPQVEASAHTMTDDDLIKVFWPDNDKMVLVNLKMLLEAASWIALVRSGNTPI